MSDKPENPPLFNPPIMIDTATGKHTMLGMTLRDYFANASLQAIITRAKGDSDGVLSKETFPHIANASYLIADAMLAERSKL